MAACPIYPHRNTLITFIRTELSELHKTLHTLVFCFSEIPYLILISAVHWIYPMTVNEFKMLVKQIQMTKFTIHSITVKILEAEARSGWIFDRLNKIGSLSLYDILTHTHVCMSRLRWGGGVRVNSALPLFTVLKHLLPHPGVKCIHVHEHTPTHGAVLSPTPLMEA